MSIVDDITDDFNDMWQELQCVVTVNGAQIRALVTVGEENLELDLGGFENRSDLSIRILRYDISELPKIGQKIIFNAGTYRIARLTHKSPFPLVTLQCQEE